MKYLGLLVFFGYILFTILALLALGFTAWVLFVHSDALIVKVSPPIFLVIIAMGSLTIMSASIIPLSMDDEKYSQKAMDIACNATHSLALFHWILV
jgi:hypothetical protein